MTRYVLAAIVLAGCIDNQLAISPVIDVPANDSASALPLDELVVAVAHSGAVGDLQTHQFTSGQTIEVADVPFGDDLVIHMTGSYKASDEAYGRTCTLAIGKTTTTTTPHLYFSRVVNFGSLQLAIAPEPRMGGRGIADLDGAGLALGGVDPIDVLTPVTDVERFDPLTGELRLLATVEPRVGAVAAALGIGGDRRIVLIGGRDAATNAGAMFVELLEPDAPATRRYERVDDAQMAREDLTATALTDGRVMAIGGTPPQGVPSDAVDEVSISNGVTSVRLLHALLAHPRARHTATRLGDDVGAPVLVAGGIDATGAPVPTAELFKPLSEDFSKTFTANTMVVPRSQHQAVRMPDGSVLIIGGVDAAGVGVDRLELFTLDAGFVDVGKLPTNVGLVDFATTTLPDGRVLLTGGRRAPLGAATVDPLGDMPLDTAFIAQLDPLNGSVNVVPTTHMSFARAGQTATLLCDGTVLVSGGTASATPAERYNPPALGRR